MLFILFLSFEFNSGHLQLSFAGDVPMRPLGCFVDNKSPYRPLPELIFTDNDPKSTVYSGISVQADDWESYMPELVCRFVTRISGTSQASVF